MNMNNWIVLFVVGNHNNFVKTRGEDNPQKRSVALKNAQTIANHGWRVWVENIKTGEVIFQSEKEKEFRENNK